MRKFLVFILSLASVFTVAQSVTVNTGASYANDVFYSFENGSVKTVSRTNWDLAFSTNNFSVSILTNNASGTELYTYTSGDTSDWSNVDTSSINWNLMYNSIETFDEGAFTMNATGHPDYGWGIYNMGSHNVVGDSIFIIKTVSGDYKKIWIEQRDAVNNMWYFKYANLDGSSSQSVTLDASLYDTKNFVYYSLDTDSIKDREPASSDWDLLFTKYYDYNIPYNVTGVLSNESHVLMEEVSQSGLNQATYNTYNEANMSTNISIVGSDWKSFNMTSFTYDISDSTVFFAKSYNANGDSVYTKFYFTAFSGSSTGEYTFEQETLLHSNINDVNNDVSLSIYPNPANGIVNINSDYTENSDIQIFNISGSLIKSLNNRKLNNLKINLSDLPSGSYLIKIKNNEFTNSELIILN